MTDATTEGQYGDAVRSLVQAVKGEAELSREVAALRAECDRLRKAWTGFTSRLGFGDDVSEPAIDPDRLVEIVEQAFSEERDHFDCPVLCEPCGEMLAGTGCEHCHGSGCGPGTATGAYEECEWCAGVGKVHPGCVEKSYADLVAERDRQAATLAKVREFAEDGIADGRGQAPLLGRALMAALAGPEAGQ